MQKKGDQTEWVWVFFIDPGPGEQILGQHDPQEDKDYIPVFSGKEDALQCYHMLKKTPDKKFEATAIMMDDLCELARAGDFVLYFLDGDGRITDTRKP